jgi:uncharacterized protein with von Willebrand factor type A (vWA) domain
MRVRFGQWSGTQDPFPEDVGADDVLNEIGDELLGGRSPEEALQSLLRRGMRGRVRGLDDLRRRVEEARRRELARLGLEGPLRDIEERLGQILDRERTALQFDPDQDQAAGKLDRLDQLPHDTASKLSALEDYRWTDRQAGQDFRDLVEQLRREVAQATFGRMAGALGSLSPQDLERMRDLLAELNGLIARQERGEDVSADFAAFK